MKRFFPLLAACAIWPLLAEPGCAQTEGPVNMTPKGPGGIVAIVGDEVVTRAELDKKVERRRFQLLRRLPASVVDRELAWIERDVLLGMIDTKLLLQLVRQEEKKGEGPYIRDVDIDAEVSRQVEESRKRGERIRDPEDYYRIVQETEGLSRDDFRKDLKQELSITKFLFLKVYKANDEFVPPLELKAFYQSHVDEFSTPIEVAFWQLIIDYSRDNRMDLLVEKVRKGVREKQDFAELAKEIAELQGQDPEKAGILYRKNFEELKDWVKPTAEVLRTLKKGEVSDAVPTAKNDIRFFMVEDLKQGEPKSFEDVQDVLTRRIREENHRRLLESFLVRQRKKVRILNFLPPIERESRDEKKDADKALKVETLDPPPAAETK